MSQDRELDKYLDGKTGLSTLYAELPQVELPDHLDAAILAEAHRAVNARPGAKPKRRWTIPLGMVATLFVAVMVGLQLPYMLKEADQTQQLKEESMAALMDRSSPEPSSPAQDERKNIQVTGQLLAKSKSASTRGEQAPMAAEAEAPAKPNSPAFAAPKESSAITGSSYTSVVPAAKNIPEAIVKPQPSPAARSLDAATVVASPPLNVPSQEPARAAKQLESKERADFDTGASLSKMKKDSGHAGSNLSDALEQHALPAARMPPPEPEQLKRSLMQPLKEEASEATLRPEDWLLRIKKLKQEGKLEEAKNELAAFKKRYPDYSVPESFEVR